MKRSRPRLRSMLSELKEQFSSYSDYRRGKNTQYEMGDIVQSAFSVFFLQSPSFLTHQRAHLEGKRKHNLWYLFGVASLPTDTLIRDQLDSVRPSEVCSSYDYLFSHLLDTGIVESFRSELDTILIPLDGTWTVRSKKLCCEGCLQKDLSNGKTLYYHSVITPCIVHPHKSEVISLPPEPITPQDGQEKQDCEINAAKRWLATHGAKYAPLGATLLGDDLYAHVPFIQAVTGKKMDYLLVCKDSSHHSLYEEIALLRDNHMLGEHTYTEGAAKKRKRYECKYMNDLPLTEQDKVRVNWLEISEYDTKGNRTYYNTFITSHLITPENISAVVTDARARWKVENENNNTLKNQGYHIEHNFGHGHSYLANTLLMLNILAFLLHTVLQLTNEAYQTLRAKIGTRKGFFHDLKTLTKYMRFKSWKKMFQFMQESLDSS